MAEAFYNSLTKTTDAKSAGTYADNLGQTLGERKKQRPGKSFVVDVMKESDIDISGAVIKQISKDDLNKYDLLVSMAGKKYTPKWLSSSPKYVYWKIRDPMGRSHDLTAKARDIVKQHVEDLIKKSK